MRLRLVTWNIHKGIGTDRRYAPDRIIDVLLHHEPDIVFLQEVDEGARRSEYDRQVDLLGDAIGLEHRAFFATHKLRTQVGQYGNAILARWPLVEVNNVELTIKPKKRRGALCAKMRMRSGKRTRTVALYNMHLGLAGFERAIQLRRFFRSHPLQRMHHRTPVILGGDLNDLWGTLGERVIEPRGFVRAGQSIDTYPSWFPMRPLDAVFLRGDIDSRRCAASRLGLVEVASDHLPLVVDLELQGKRRRRRQRKKSNGTKSNT